MEVFTRAMMEKKYKIRTLKIIQRRDIGVKIWQFGVKTRYVACWN